MKLVLSSLLFCVSCLSSPLSGASPLSLPRIAAPFAPRAAAPAVSASPDGTPVQPVIFQGFEVPVTDPLAASIVEIRVDLGTESRTCSGFLISPRHVLSAAQCFFRLGETENGATVQNIRLHWSGDDSQNSAGTAPHSLKIHPGYLKKPSRDQGWIQRKIEASPWDLALLSFAQDLPQHPRALPLDTQFTQLESLQTVQVLGMDQGKLTQGQMKVTHQTEKESIAQLRPIPGAVQYATDSDIGGPVMITNADGQQLVWGILVSQQHTLFSGPGSAYVIQLHAHMYWLMNQMQSEMGQWLTEVFQPSSTRNEVPCRPVVKKRAPVKIPKKVPVPTRRPRTPNAAAMGRLSQPFTSIDNGLVHKVIIMGEEVSDDSPLLKSLARVRVNGGSCSGTLISPIHVLTAAHCFDNAKDLNPILTKVEFYRNSRDVILSLRALRIRYHKTYQGYLEDENGHLKTESPTYDVSSGHDIALITLDQAVPAPFSPMPLLPFGLKLNEGDPVQVAGTGRDSLATRESMGFMKFTTMTMGTKRESNRWTLNPVGQGGAMPGDSGGAALHFDKNNMPYIWGVITQTSVNEEKRLLYSSTVLPIIPHAGWIFQQIQTDLFDIQNQVLKPKIEIIRTPIRNCSP